MGGQPALPLQQPDLPVYAPADVPGDEVARLRQELLTKKQAILRWEDGMKQAYSVTTLILLIFDFEWHWSIHICCKQFDYIFRISV